MGKRLHRSFDSEGMAQFTVEGDTTPAAPGVMREYVRDMESNPKVINPPPAAVFAGLLVALALTRTNTPAMFVCACPLYQVLVRVAVKPPHKVKKKKYLTQQLNLVFDGETDRTSVAALPLPSPHVCN